MVLVIEDNLLRRAVVSMAQCCSSIHIIILDVWICCSKKGINNLTIIVIARRQQLLRRMILDPCLCCKKILLHECTTKTSPTLIRYAYLLPKGSHQDRWNRNNYNSIGNTKEVNI